MEAKWLSKVMKLGKDAELEMAVYVLFRQKREEWIPITRAIVQAKVLELHTRLHESQGDGVDEIPAQFAVSAGWLWRFCWCHNIRQLALQGEKLSADEPPAESFIPEFQKFVKDNDYSLDQVFNCDESGLYYKLLPLNSLVMSSEKSASGCKTQKERVTISACSNASGSIKLPLVLIVSTKNPSVLKTLLVPVILFHTIISKMFGWLHLCSLTGHGSTKPLFQLFKQKW